MRRWLALLLVWPSIAPAEPAPYRSLTAAFAAFVDSTADLPMAERVAGFHARVAPLFPAFYRPRDGRGPADLDRRIARSIATFPRDRTAFAAVEQAFADEYPRAVDRLARAFPGFRPTGPVYLLHSLGELDAGTRMFAGRRALIFAVDGIAIADPPDALPLLIDHELFHIAHHRAFPGCLAVWCSLWREGLAVYAASILHPEAGDRQLGLEDEGSIRDMVERDRRAALCLLQAKLAAVDRRSIRTFFLSGGGAGGLPPRFGYYLGYLVAQRAGQTQSLATLSRMPPKPARQLVTRTVAAMADQVGGCVTRATQPIAQ